MQQEVCLFSGKLWQKHTIDLHINNVKNANVNNSNWRSAAADGASTVTSGATSADHSTYMLVVQEK